MWLTVITLGCAGASAPSTAAAPAGWVLSWSDEFDGPVGAPIDSTRWSFDLGDGCSAGNCGWGNQEREYYTDRRENIALNGQGQLAITALPTPNGLTCYYGACRYTSAKVKTQGKRVAAPGRVEARIKLPAGQGLWPAFWMLGSSFPTTPWPASGELDIMENHGSHMGSTSSAIHGPGYFGNTPFVHSHTLATGTFSDAFHTFAVEWDTKRIAFLVDGETHYVVSRADIEARGPWAFDQPFFVILNLAVGGNFDGHPASDAIFPATMLVDYVRVFTRAGA